MMDMDARDDIDEGDSDERADTVVPSRELAGQRADRVTIDEAARMLTEDEPDDPDTEDSIILRPWDAVLARKTDRWRRDKRIRNALVTDTVELKDLDRRSKLYALVPRDPSDPEDQSAAAHVGGRDALLVLVGPLCMNATQTVYSERRGETVTPRYLNDRRQIIPRNLVRDLSKLVRPMRVAFRKDSEEHAGILRLQYC